MVRRSSVVGYVAVFVVLVALFEMHRRGMLTVDALARIGLPHIGFPEAVGYAAAAAVFTTFCMNTMLPLRSVAVVSNLLFIMYGLLNEVYPVLFLHGVLLPVNLIKLVQIARLSRDIARASASDMSVEKFLPFMTERKFAAGHVLFNAGDHADKMYYVAEGDVHIPEFSRALGPGALIGEIGLFSPERKRTAGAICETDCRIYEMSEKEVRRLYFQNPAFGYGLMRLVIGRLLENRSPVIGNE